MTEQKSSGVTRIIKAAGYSLDGLRAAWKHEAAFRQEVVAMAALFPLGLFLGQNNVERAVLIIPIVIVIITELVNSALEAVVDRIGPEFNTLSKRTKDLGSAAVFVSLALVIITWGLILI